MVEVAVANCRSKPYSKAWCIGLGYVCTMNGNNIYHHFRSLPAILDIRQKNQSSTTMIIRQFEINNIRQLDMSKIKRDCCEPEVD